MDRDLASTLISLNPNKKERIENRVYGDKNLRSPVQILPRQKKRTVNQI